MKLELVELRRLRLPLVAPFRASHGEVRERDVLLVRVAGPEGEGWGECSAPEEPTYTSEHVEGAHLVIRRFLAPRLLTTPRLSAHLVGPLLSGVRGHRMAKAALEAAVLDAELSAAGRSLAEELGAVQEAVVAGVAVGIAGSTRKLLDTVESYLSQGYRSFKLKIEPGWDLEPVRAVRERFGDELLLQADANGAYSLGDARHLARLDPFDLLLLEQPLPAGCLEGHAAISRQISTPVCLDESVVSAASAAAAIDRGACSAVNVKAARVGGYLEARRVHDVCAAHGVPVRCGGMLETGVGRSANLALAALPGFTLPSDLSASQRYFARDLTDPLTLEEGGLLRVPASPGNGPRPDPSALAEVTLSVEELRRGAA